jgi:hypothetical protein
MSQWKLIAVGMLCFVVSARAHVLSQRVYKVTEVLGAAYSWEPWSDRWERLNAGTELHEGTLVQVTENGRISVAVPQVASGNKIGRGSSIVRFSAPAVVRLDENFLRKIHLSSYFVPQLPASGEMEPETDSGPIKPLLHTVEEAYQRFIAVLAHMDVKALPPPRMPAEEKSGETEWVSKLKPIVIVTPSDKAIVVADHMPATVKLVWRKPPGSDLEYGVHLWDANEARKGPLATTRFEFYTLQIPKEGRYFVQVASTDGNYQSKAQSLHIALPLTLSTKPTPFAKAIGEAVNPSNKPNPRFPVRDFVFVASKLPATLEFQWDYAEKASPREAKDTLVILDAQGKERVRKPVDTNNAALSFSGVGEYRWFVERKIGTAESFKKYASEPMPFQVLLRKADSIGLLTAQSRGVFYLEP